jgi:hypothetical protein
LRFSAAKPQMESIGVCADRAWEKVMRISNLSALSDDEFAILAVELEKHTALGKALAWAGTHTNGEFIPQIVLEVVPQDEFTNDVVIPYKEYFLVYDTT